MINDSQRFNDSLKRVEHPTNDNDKKSVKRSLCENRLHLCLITAFCLLSGSALSSLCTESGRWGHNCANICAPGCIGNTCDAETGICENRGCLPGWFGDKCNQAECEKSTCEDLGGSCIAPDICQCPANEQNIVASVAEDINNINNYQVKVTCDNLKRSGMKGAGIAMVVLSACLIMCGTADKLINKGEYKYGRKN